MAQTIALVDDDRNILTSIAMALEAEGYHVSTYADGDEALTGFDPRPRSTLRFSISRCPGWDGMELRGKSYDKSSRMPVLFFLTSKDDEIDGGASGLAEVGGG